MHSGPVPDPGTGLGPGSNILGNNAASTVGAQSIARAQSIALLHSNYVITPKKHKF